MRRSGRVVAQTLATGGTRAAVGAGAVPRCLAVLNPAGRNQDTGAVLLMAYHDFLTAGGDMLTPRGMRGTGNGSDQSRRQQGRHENQA